MAKPPMMAPGDMGAPNGKAPAATPPTDEELSNLVGEVDKKKQEGMGDGAPEPTRPYRLKTMIYLRDQINAFGKQFPGAPTVEWEPDASMPDWRDPMPPELWGPLTAIVAAIKAVDTDGKFARYDIDPTEATSDEALRAMGGTLATAMKDKALMEALKSGPGGEGEPEAAEPPPEGKPPKGEDLSEYTDRM